MKVLQELFVLIICCFSIEILYAQPGTLDKSFGDNGIALTKIGPRDNSIFSLAIQQDAKIISAGGIYNGSNYEFALARYDTNGVLDQGFGLNGIVTTNISPRDNCAFSIIIQADGKLVLAGYAFNGSYYDFALARYNNNGSLDSTFGLNGIVITSFGKTSIIYSSAFESDGKIIAVGCLGSPYSPGKNIFALCRYNIDGHLDETFGTGGKVLTELGSVDDVAKSVKIRKNGKIVVCGWSYKGLEPNFALVQYNYDGTLDETFGNEGSIVTSIPLTSSAWSLAIQNNEKIIVVGDSYDGLHENFTLVRYNSNGAIDTLFGSKGSVVTKIGQGDNSARAVNLQLDGKILVSGYSLDSNLKKDFALVRYDSIGNLDESFGLKGIVTTNITPFDDLGYSSIIQANGKIIIGGEAFYNDSCSYFTLAQYLLGFNTGIIEANLSKNVFYIYPNPFYDRITLKYNLTTDSCIYIKLIDIQGKVLNTFIDNQIQRRDQSMKLIFNKDLAAGFYYLIMSTENQTVSIKIIKVN
jgi:uncharacterized delta-60 repeat protein